MKKTPVYIVIAFLLISALFLPSCIKKPVYPSEPVIAYKDFLRYGTNPLVPDSVDLVISFTDNEGDIGLGQSDTSGIFKYGNLIMTYYYYDKDSLQWFTLDDPTTPTVADTLRFYYRVPPVLPDDDDSEPMKGLIYAKQKPFFVVHDSIKYEVYMYDKALHKSNVIETPPFGF